MTTAELIPPRTVMEGLRSTAILGGLFFLLGLFVAPQRAWAGYLIGFAYFTGLALAGGLFLSVLTLSGARWAATMQRIPEAMTATLPVAALLGIGLVGGVHSLYEWSHTLTVAEDPILSAKSSYLNLGFFLIRMIVFFGLWIWLSRGMVRALRRRDFADDRARCRHQLISAALFLPVFALTFSLASVDWLQSIEPHWFSTIYALVTLSGVGCSGLAICIILAVFLKRGPLRGIIRDEQLDDLGKVGIGFALFWGYIWYCQYMLIWYTDLPEETPYYVLRSQGAWKALSSVNVLVNWAVPFFALMPRAVRRSEVLMVRIAWVMLAGQALNLYMLVEPALMKEGPVLGLWELGPLIGALGLFFYLTLRGLSKFPLVPADDPGRAERIPHGSQPTASGLS